MSWTVCYECTNGTRGYVHLQREANIEKHFQERLTKKWIIPHSLEVVDNSTGKVVRRNSEE